MHLNIYLLDIMLGRDNKICESLPYSALVAQLVRACDC